jgi:hypothetical protein
LGKASDEELKELEIGEATMNNYRRQNDRQGEATL